MNIAEAFALLSDPHKLPSFAQMVEAWTKFKRNSMSVDNILLWYSLIENKEGSPVFEIWNSDYIDKLAEYLISNTSKTVLEVGAGNGKLSHCLRERGVNAVATDNFSWKIKPAFCVERLDIEEALCKYKPDVVLSSWMPYTHDWTPMFRHCASVQEYILIGETDGGCCGADSTWAVGDAPGGTDGFVRRDIDILSRLQLCRTDHPDYIDDIFDYTHSRTVAFRRQPHE